MKLSLRSTLSALALATIGSTALAADYAIDPTHTFASFQISHFGASMNEVRFDKKEGKLSFDAQAKTGSIDIAFEVDSLTSGVAPFDKHLKSPEIFDAEAHPDFRFAGSDFKFDGDALSEVAGELTLKDQTHPVSFKAVQFKCYENPMFKAEVCGGVFEATIDRTQWGMDYGLNMVAGKEVRLIARIEGVRQ